MLLAAVLLGLTVAQDSIGIFEASTDIGQVKHAGSVKFDQNLNTYLVTGSGENMWFAKDAFHFVYKKVNGNQSIEAGIQFIGSAKNQHCKACLIIRQSLDPDSPYVDIAEHRDGLTSLQYRDTKAGATHEIQTGITLPNSVKLSKRGSTIIAEVNDTYSGASISLDLKEPYYVGIGLCSHDADATEKAIFNSVAINPVESGPGTLYSTLETVDIASTDRRVVRAFEDHIEAPNWTPDGKHLIYNSQGLLYRIPWTNGEPTKIDTGFANRCNNDHGISPDGKHIVISDQSQNDNQSAIYVLPIRGGTPKPITTLRPSYWHGWSPDGRTLAYCAQRDGQFGIFTISAEGGAETRLTTAERGKLDDGPDYTPDGKHIVFNSDRTGRMQIYQMNVDGSNPEALTNDDRNNWFGHVSPDGKWMVYVSYEPDVQGHPANKDVELRLQNRQTKAITTLAKLFGGQGSLNVPSWSPDSKRVAFVSYQFVN